jgi:hypothetical protein
MDTHLPTLLTARRVATLLVQLFLICVLGPVMLATAAFGANTFAATGSLAIPRPYCTATLLPNGMVLVTGGFNGDALASAELYNPATGTWTTTGSLAPARQRQIQSTDVESSQPDGFSFRRRGGCRSSR